MKTLYLLRHAQTLPSEAGRTDIERQLTSNGLIDAAILGRVMQTKEQSPATILCSSAQRTRQTLDQLLETLPAAPIHYDEAIYSGTHDSYFAMIQEADDTHDSLLLVAHNPSIHGLAMMLMGEQSSATLMQQLAIAYAPGTLSVIECDCDNWANIQPCANNLVELISPQDYNAPQTPARWM